MAKGAGQLKNKKKKSISTSLCLSVYPSVWVEEGNKFRAVLVTAESSCLLLRTSEVGAV